MLSLEYRDEKVFCTLNKQATATYEKETPYLTNNPRNAVAATGEGELTEK